MAIVLSTASCVSKMDLVEDDRPNILLIVADDLGYSDLGIMGSEISTPNIDKLADKGSLFINFYTAATCSPTRAMLLTGVDNHVAGLGNMAENVPNHPEQIGKPGYEGYLNNRVVSVAELLKESGYYTVGVGKWHLGIERNHSPYARGFERSFMLMTAYANHYYPDTYYNPFWENDDYGNYPEGEFSTEVYTEKLIENLKRNVTRGRPFFAYAAYTAPHWPLQAPLKDIESQIGNYQIGYDSLRTKRIEGLKKKGIIEQNKTIAEIPKVKGQLYGITNDEMKPWDSLTEEERVIESRKMEIYAAMIANLDNNIGHLISKLKEDNLYDNTLIIFMSDNGAAILDAQQVPKEAPLLDYMGTPNSFVGYGPQWACASSGANYLYKGYIADGGIRTPMIVKPPFQNKRDSLTNQFVTVLDIVPTILDVANIEYPEKHKGNIIAPNQGESIIPFLKGEQSAVHQDDYVMGWELFGRYALRKGEWKITQIEPPFGAGQFELFNMLEDPGETQDLSENFPEKYQELLEEWEKYVVKNGVILKE